MEINWTPIINATIALIALIMTGVLIPLIKRKINADDLEEIGYWVEVAVTAAFQLFGYHEGESREETNEKRRQYVHEFLMSKGIVIDESTVNMIESAVITVKTELFGGHQE